MAQNGGQIKYGIGFDVDTSGLNKLKQSLSEIKKLTATEIQKMNFGMDFDEASKDLDKIRKDAVKVEAALEKAFNKDLGTINVVKFRKELENIRLDKLHANFSKAGAAGQNAFRNITTEILTTNMQLKQSHTLINKMAETMANTVKWGIASSVMNTFTGSVQKAYGYVKNLDSSLNDIRIVTGKSAEEMDIFAVKANKAAKALGQSTRNYTDASLIYYQQGLAEQDVQARTEATLKAANVTQQSGEAVSEQLTAVWNGYKVSAQEAELYVDKLAAVAASTATDLEELSVGMGKVASAAATMGVDIDQLNGHLATVISVTRQAPESVGTAFKTIYARMSDLKLGGTDEDGLGLGDVSGTMEAMGIQVLDQTGNLRDMGDVMEDVAAKWDTWTEAQKTAMAQVMAGKRQYNNLMALFENWDMYEEAVNTSATAMGTLQNQQDIYMESTEAHLQGLSTSMEDLYDSILDEGTINTVADSLAGLADLAGNFVDAIGGGRGILLNFGSIATKVFSRNIAEGIMTSVNNIKGLISNTQQLKAETELVAQFQDQLFGKNDKDLENLINKKKEAIELRDVMSETQQTQANDFIKTINELQNLKQGNEERAKETLTALSEISDTKELKIEDIVDKDGLKRVEDLTEQLKAFEDQINVSEKTIERFNEGLEETGKTNEELNNNLDENVKNLTKLASKAGATGKETDALITKQAAYKAILKDSNATEEQRIKALEEYREAYRETVDVLKRKHKEFQEATDPSKLSLGETLSKVEEDWDRFVKNLKTTQVIQAFVNVAASIGQIAGAMQSLGNIDNILTDDSLSGWEKFIQIISILSMAIPQLVSGFGGLGKEILKLTTIWATHIIAQKKAQEEAKKTEKAEENLGNEVEETTEKIKKENKVLNQNAKEKDKVAKTGKTNEKMGKSSKLMSNLNTIAGKFGTTIGGLLGTLGAFAGFLAIIGIGIGVFISQWTKAEREAEKARKGLEEVKKATTSLRNEVQETTDALDRYKEIQDTLKELEEGTIDWKKALQESNAEVLKLLENIPELAKYIENNSGQLTITTEGMEFIEKANEDRLRNINLLEFEASQISAEKTYEAERVKQRRAAYMDSGAEGSMSSGIGAQATQGTTQAKMSDAQVYNKAIEMGAEGTIAFDSLESILKAIPQATEDQAQKILNNADSVLELVNQKIALDESILLRDELIAQDLLSQSRQYEMMSDEEKNAVTAGATSVLDKEADALYESKYKDMWGGLTDEEVQNQLMEIIGAEDIENLLNNEFKLKIDGEWTEAIPDEMARRYLAQIEAGSNANIDKLVNNYSRIMKSLDMDDKGKEAVLSFAGKSEGDLSEFKTEEELTQFQNALHDNLDTVNAIRLGFESQYDALEWIDQQIQERQQQIENQKTALNQEGQKAFAQNIYEHSNRKEHIDGMIADGSSDFMINISEMLANAEIQSMSQKLFENIDFSTLEFPIKDIMANIDEEKMSLMVDLYNEGNIEEARKLGEEIIKGSEEKIKDSKIVEKNYNKNETEEFGFDIDKEQFQDLTKHIQGVAEESEELADYLKEDEKAAQEVAKELLRYDKALESVQENYEDWSKALEDGGNLMDQAGMLEDIRDAYGNLLDLDASQLSNDFVKNADNLRLMQQAANGSEEAYRQLQNAVQEDILAHAKMDKAQWDASFNDLMNKYYQGQNLEDIEAGAKLDNTEFLNGLTEMINAAGLTAEEATALLSSMGIDAEIVEGESNGVETSSYTEATPFFENIGHNFESFVEGGDGHIEAPAVKYQTKQVPITTPKQGKGFGLRVKSATKSSGGNFKFSNTSHGSGSKGSSGGGGGGGGGGGSGSGSTPKYTKKDKYKPKKDRYRQVNIELDNLARRLEKLNNEQERLFGSDLSKNLENQLAILKEQVKVTKEKIELAKQEQNDLQTDLGEYGIKFDKEGNISNYDKIIGDRDSELKKLTDQWNASSADWQESEAGKEFDEKLKEKEQELDKILGLIEDYDTLIYKTIPDMNDEILDAAYQEIDLQIEQFNIEAELRLDLTDAIKDWADFKREVLDDIDDDDYSGLAESYVNEYKDLWGSGLGDNLMRDMNDIMGSINNINSDNPVADGLYVTYDGNGNLVTDEAQAMEDLEEKQKQLQDHLTDLKELEEEIDELYLDSIDAVGEAYEAQVENFEFINDQLEHSLNMIELLKGETTKAYEAMGQVFAEQAKNYESMLKTQKESVDYYKQMMDAETDPKAKEQWAELWKNAVQELNDTVVASIENLNNQYQNSINQAIKEMDDALGGSKKKAEWEIALKKDENYLDEVNRMFETQSFENKVKDSINNTDSLSAQKRLNKLLDEELSKLKEKDKLTQYDIDRANQMYEIELKKIALEEAQQNKSKMRLRRDSSGNYSYQFVADEDAQAQAQRELDEAQNSLYNMDKDEYKNKLNEFNEIEEEYFDKLREYSELSYEERKAREEEFQAYFNYYQERMLELSGDAEAVKQNLNQSTYDNLISLYDQDEVNFANMTANEKQSLIDNLQSPIADTKLMIVGEEGLTKVFEAAEVKINEANVKMKAGIEGVAAAAGTTPEGLTTVMSNAAETVQETFIPAQQGIIDETKKTVTEVGNWKKEVDKVKESYEDTYEAIEKTLKASQKLREDQLKQEANKEEAKKTGTTTNNKTTTPTTNKTTTSTTNNKKVTFDNIKIGDKVKYTGGWYYYDSTGTDPAGNRGPGKTVTIQNKAKGAKYPIAVQSNDSAYGWLKTDQLQKLDTGGYTGKWNSKAGKIAMLHEKELVLNKNDTENMLKMISMVREIMGLSSQVSTLDTENEDKSTQQFHNELSNLIKTVNNFKEEYLYEQKVDSLNLLQKFEELKHNLEDNEQLDKLVNFEEYNDKHQELLNEERKKEMEMLLNHLNKAEEMTEVSIKENRNELRMLERNVSSNLTELKHIIKGSFENSLEKIYSVFNRTFDGGGGRAINDAKQNVIVNIDANFPDATSAKEIQMAFDNLVNIASQRAYSTSALRKK